MAPIRTLLSSVILAIALASVNAVPSAPGATHATHHTRSIGTRGLKLETYHPPTSFQTFGAGLDHPAPALIGRGDDEATAFVSKQLGVDSSTVEFKSGFTSGSARTAYVRQRYNGIPFANAVANVAFKDDKVVTFGSSFVKPTQIAASKPTIDLKSALPKIEAQLEGKYNNHPATLEYLARPDGTAALTYVAQIQNEDVNSWYEAFIDAHTGELLSATDFTADNSYRVVPITEKDPREGFQVLTDPQDLTSSPSGWHSTGTTTTTTTSGNNVIAYKTSQTTGLTTQSSATLNFLATFNAAQSPTQGTNLDAARTNAFYIANTVHDITYRYGFTETAFNFQTNNFGKGGLGNDRVLLSVQDSSGTNNANFATPPDGQSGQARMYTWTLTSPNRDGALENDILVHELTHGTTNRLTGGGTGRCLQTTESGGMGEGWSDAFAEWTQQKSGTVVDYILGDYVENNSVGIRTHPYSTSATTNPLRYSSVATQNEVHNIGEVWANILHNVYAALVTAHGWSATAVTNTAGTEGNIVYLHLFMDALSLQPCNPTFVQARDAWIQADVNRYAGANKCVLWKAFASRGLGTAAANFVDSSAVPSGC